MSGQMLSFSDCLTASLSESVGWRAVAWGLRLPFASAPSPRHTWRNTIASYRLAVRRVARPRSRAQQQRERKEGAGPRGDRNAELMRLPRDPPEGPGALGSISAGPLLPHAAAAGRQTGWPVRRVAEGQRLWQFEGEVGKGARSGRTRRRCFIGHPFGGEGSRLREQLPHRRLSASSMRIDQAAISSSVRRQPSHQPLVHLAHADAARGTVVLECLRHVGHMSPGPR